MKGHSVLLLLFISAIVFGQRKEIADPPPPPICDESKCSLPECYCDPLAIPGGIKAKNTPQMILVSYTGAVTEDTRDQIRSVFPVKLKNPNGCPIAITIFVTGKFTDYCEVHELYVRGHEIATQAFNATYSGDWTKAQWKKQIGEHRDKLRDDAHIPEDHIQGVRAPLNRPGGDKQYSMLVDSSFLYDATMLIGPVTWEDGFTDKSYWPHTLYATWEKCQTPDCPLSSYPNLWEVPITRILVEGNQSSCAFLDECAAVEGISIEELLKKNFERSYLGNRAPFQINLQARAFFNRRLVTDLSNFMTSVMMYDDVWFVTYQEAISWVQAPASQSDVYSGSLWGCPDRKFNTKCVGDDDDDGNSTAKKKKMELRNPFTYIIDVRRIWIYQVCFLTVAYFLIYRYDKVMQERQKTKDL